MKRVSIDLSNLPAITNDAFYPTYWNESRNLILIGGAGSGKSVYAIDKHLFRIVTEQHHRFLFCRKVGRTIRDSIWRETLAQIEVFGLSRYAKVNKSAFTIEFPLFRSEIIFTGLDDPEKIKSVSGITGVLMEEASDFELSDYKQLNLRLRGITPNYKQLVLATNPTIGALWIKKNFIDSEHESATVLKTTYRDNRFLDPEYVRELERETDPYFRGVYTNGDFTELRGLVFSSLVIAPHGVHDADLETLYPGIDFGENAPYACIKAGLDNRDIYVTDELYGRFETNRDFIDAIDDFLPKNVPVKCDSEAPSKIRELVQAGYRAEAVKKGADSVSMGIDTLKRYTIHVDPYRCPNLAREIQEYKYKETPDGEMTGEPVKRNDHAVDALRYAFEPLWNVNKAKAGSFGKRRFGL